MRAIFITLAAAAVLAFTAFGSSAEEARRQLGAHEHGHGRLNIAIEDKIISMELEVPGADIVGFEHAPSTPAQIAAIDSAKAKLKDSLSLFGPSPKAGCVQKSVQVSTEAAHEDEHEHGEANVGAKKSGSETEADHHHSEFHVVYSLECKSLSALTSLSFGYFKEFPGAQELDISLISPKGQTSYEVSRNKQTVDLTGSM